MINEPEVDVVIPVKSFSTHKLCSTEGAKLDGSTRATLLRLSPAGHPRRRQEEDDSNSDTGSKSAYNSNSANASDDNTSDTEFSNDDTSDAEYHDDNPVDTIPHEHRKPGLTPPLSNPNEDKEPTRKHKALCYKDIILQIIQDPNKAGRVILAIEVLFRHHKGANKKPKPYISQLKSCFSDIY